jgi:hypothetical protein
MPESIEPHALPCKCFSCDGKMQSCTCVAGIQSDVKLWGLSDSDEGMTNEAVTRLEEIMEMNSRTNMPSSLQSRLFVPFFLNARYGSLGFDL